MLVKSDLRLTGVKNLWRSWLNSWSDPSCWEAWSFRIEIFGIKERCISHRSVVQVAGWWGQGQAEWIQTDDRKCQSNSKRPTHCHRAAAKGSNKYKVPAFERSIAGRAHKVWKKLPQELIMSKGEDQWQSLTKECQSALTGKKSKHKPKQPKQETQIEQSDQSSKYYTLAEKSGVLPLGFNEHTKILRSSNLTNLSVDQSIKSIINA